MPREYNMGDYRSVEWGSQRSTQALNSLHSITKILSSAHFPITRGAETIARQQHDLSSSSITCTTPVHVTSHIALIPSRHQLHTQHVLDTFPLTNHSPLTVGSSSSGRSLKIHNPTCEVCLGPFAARPFSKVLKGVSHAGTHYSLRYSGSRDFARLHVSRRR